MNSEKQQDLRLELVSACAIFAFLLYSMKTVLFLGTTTLTHDNLYWYLPFFHFFAEGITRGEFYLWNPFSHAGEPTITAYLQLRLLDPISVLTVLIGKLFTQDVVILFSWDRFLRALIGSVGAYILLRRWTDQVLVRISLQAVVLFTPLLTNGLHQNGITDQFYIAPYFLIFLLRLVHGRDYRLYNWVGLALTFGISFQSYFFVGTSVLGLFVLAGFLLFRREGLICLVQYRPNVLRAFMAVVLLLIMSAPMFVYYMDHNEYVYTARALDERRITQIEEMRAHGGSFSTIDARMKDGNSDQSLMMPYGIIWLTGTFSKPSDLLGFIAPPDSEVIAHKQRYSEAYLYIGLLVFLGAVYGMLFAQHELKRVWLVVAAFFALLILGPIGLLHQALYYAFPPLWFIRHTHQFVGFFILALMYFYVLGADRVIQHLRAPSHDVAAPSLNALFSRWLTAKNVVSLIAWLSLGTILVLSRYAYQMAPFKHALVLVFIIFAFFIASNFLLKKGDSLPLYGIVAVAITFVGIILVAFLGNELVRYDSDIVGKTHAPPFLIAGITVLVVFLRRWVGRASTFVALVAALLLVAYANSKNWTALTERILAFLLLPIVLVLISRYLGSNAKKWIPHALVLCVILELALAVSVVPDWKEVRPDYCLDIPTSGVTGNVLPERRVVTRVGCAISTYRQPIRYMELLSRQYTALGLPAHYPSEGNTSVGNERFGDVASVGIWNTFSYLQGYNKLLSKQLPEAVLEEIFAINKPIIQFRENLYAVNDFIGTISAMEPSEAVDMLSRGIFVESGAQEGAARMSDAKSFDGDAAFERGIAYGYNRTVIDTDSNKSGYLYFADGYDKYWKAKIDGTEVPVMRANLNFKAIKLPAGKHSVTFEYAPAKLRGAIFAFELTFLLGMGYVVFYEWHRRRSSGCPASWKTSSRSCARPMRR